MHIEIVQNGIDGLRLLRDPGVHALQELNPIDNGASRIGLRESLARRWTKGPKDVALAPPTIMALQNCSCDRTSFGGRARALYFPSYIWHWQYARKMTYLRGHSASLNRKDYRYR
jgi:hypothetical protein